MEAQRLSNPIFLILGFSQRPDMPSLGTQTNGSSLGGFVAKDKLSEQLTQGVFKDHWVAGSTRRRSDLAGPG